MATTVSVVIPMFNAEEYIETAIGSVLSQSGIDYELIIVDDGSTDSSRCICERYLCENVRLYQQKNSGASIARNLGLHHARGDYVLFLDADDMLFGGLFEQVAPLFSTYEPHLIIGGFIREESGGETFDMPQIQNADSIEEYFFLPPYPCNKFYRRDVALDNELVFDDTKIAQDLNYYYKYLGIVDTSRIVAIETCFCRYRAVGNSISHSIDLRILDVIKSINCCIDYYQGHGIGSDRLRYMLAASLRHICYQLEKTNRFENKQMGAKARLELQQYWMKIRKTVGPTLDHRIMYRYLRADLLYLYTLGKLRCVSR